jgi:ATP-dependent 26S proteasome regulatory subunit
MTNTGNNREFYIDGIPNNIPKDEDAVFRARISKALNPIADKIGKNQDIKIIISTHSQIKNESNNAKTSVDKNGKGYSEETIPIEVRAEQYKSQEPLYQFERVVIPDNVKKELERAASLFNVTEKVFYEWNVISIEPFPRRALNFYGKPGTGKTLAAHALASKINKPILIASYANVESKFVGDGPKNVEALFYAAERDGAILFIDEADSLLSSRIANPMQGSERASNSLCSQLLICLDKFKGIVIFSTNFVENYDKAFKSRVRSIKFPMPDQKSRREIWKTLLEATNIPLSSNLDFNTLSEIDDVSGREIKEAIIETAIEGEMKQITSFTTDNFVEAIKRIKESRVAEEQESKVTKKANTIRNLDSEEGANILEKLS